MADIAKELATLSAAVVPGAPIFASLACANFVAQHDIAARFAEMAAALEPFAKVAGRAAKGEIDLRDLAWPLLGVFDADDFLRARAILTKLGGEHG